MGDPVVVAAQAANPAAGRGETSRPSGPLRAERRSLLWLLKLTVKILKMVERATLSGLVTDTEDPPALLPGAQGSAQIANPSAPEVAEQVLVETSTLADSEGLYTLYLPANTYNVVAHAGGHAPACERIALTFGDQVEQNFALTATDMGAFAGAINPPGALEDQSVTLSFRRPLVCGDTAEDVEILVNQVALTGGGNSSYAVELPIGPYTIVASTEGRGTKEYAVESAASISPAAPVWASLALGWRNGRRGRREGNGIDRTGHPP